MAPPSCYGAVLSRTGRCFLVNPCQLGCRDASLEGRGRRVLCAVAGVADARPACETCATGSKLAALATSDRHLVCAHGNAPRSVNPQRMGPMESTKIPGLRIRPSTWPRSSTGTGLRAGQPNRYHCSHLAIILAGTSSDRALRRLGRPAWTWLHRLAQTILVLSLLHGSYFLFIHFTESFHKAPLANLDWFRIPFLTAGLAVIALQIAAFWTHTERGETIVVPTKAGHRRQPR